ncbi:DUF2062 domain-containing protein [Natronococcus wangiae]|uniref:DUF2062 domain-containing protein n=1 Tax=Natronococcus wangiae TaxID=3068275 RepID=UPI00273FA1B6|nr:DUF2062 domain-containing protein [Natronococcus sp. AD5]
MDQPRFEWANKFTFVAAVAVLNPVVKGGVYVARCLIGIHLLGSVPGVTHHDVRLDAGTDVLVRLLVGNVVLALGFTVVGYAVAYQAAHAVRQRRSS